MGQIKRKIYVRDSNGKYKLVDREQKLDTKQSVIFEHENTQKALSELEARVKILEGMFNLANTGKKK